MMGRVVAWLRSVVAWFNISAHLVRQLNASHKRRLALRREVAELRQALAEVNGKCAAMFDRHRQELDEMRIERERQDRIHDELRHDLARAKGEEVARVSSAIRD